MPGLGCRNNRCRSEMARKLWLPPVASKVLCCNRAALDLRQTYRHTTPTGFRDPSHERTRRRFQLPVPWLQHDLTLWSVIGSHENAAPRRVLDAQKHVPPPSAVTESTLILRFTGRFCP